MQRMEDLGIAPTPKNYAVWYGYCEGTNQDLKRAVDMLGHRPEAFTPEKNEELYARFFGTDTENEALRDIGGMLQNAMANVLSGVGGAGTEAARFTEFLSTVSDQIEDSEAVAGPFRGLLRDIGRETRRMREETKSLESKLNAASGEVEVLRKSLEIVRHEAMTDGLTGLANRKYFDHTLRRETTRAMEEGCELSLLLLDIDHFKKFNDTYGHQLGDQVLRVVAKAMVEVIPPSTVAARYGGEEFAIVCPNGTQEDAIALGEVVRSTVASKRIVRKTTQEELGNITMTIGVATYIPGESIRHMISRADEALYRGKQNGRNQVVEALVVDELPGESKATIDADIV